MEATKPPTSIDDLISSHSEVAPANPDAVASEQRRLAEEQAENQTESPAASAPDSGDDFERDSFGNVVMCKDGVTPRKRRGRRKGGGDASAASAPAPAPTDPNAPPAQATTANVVDEAVATGLTTAHLLTSLATMSIGPEWQPSEPELIGMSDAYARVYRHYGIGEIHPLIAAVVITFAYAAPRFNSPNTQAKLQSVAETVRGWTGKKKPQPRDDEDNIGNR